MITEVSLSSIPSPAVPPFAPSSLISVTVFVPTVILEPAGALAAKSSAEAVALPPTLVAVAAV